MNADVTSHAWNPPRLLLTAAVAEAAASVPGAGAATAAPTPTGLVAERSGPCAGLLRVAVVSPAACTHGPHAPPAGLAVDRTAITGQV